MIKIYLCGYIQASVIEQCKAWRQELMNCYNNYKGQKYPVEFLNPLNGEDMFLDLTKFDHKNFADNIHNMILYKDIQAVKQSDLVICNPDTFNEKRPAYGTYAELGWAILLDKPVIMITKDEEIINYPFFKRFIFVDSVEDLVNKKYINLFYKAWNDSL
jgi:hypothetical protein